MSSVSSVCFVCEKMRERKPQRETGLVQECLLCGRDYCQTHKSAAHPGVCEINHQTYYRNHSKEIAIYPTIEARAAAMERPESERRDAIREFKVKEIEIQVNSLREEMKRADESVEEGSESRGCDELV